MTSKANKHQNITQIKHIKQYEYSSKTRQKKKEKKYLNNKRLNEKLNLELLVCRIWKKP